MKYFGNESCRPDRCQESNIEEVIKEYMKIGSRRIALFSHTLLIAIQKPLLYSSIVVLECDEG